MSDTMLHGVLCMPPKLWRDDEIDKRARYSRYLEASRRIEDLERELAAATAAKEKAERERDVMRDLLIERCFYTAGRSEYKRQGYSATVEEVISLRDIVYRGAKLYDTPEEAVDAVVSAELKEARG